MLHHSQYQKVTMGRSFHKSKQQYKSKKPADFQICAVHYTKNVVKPFTVTALGIFTMKSLVGVGFAMSYVTVTTERLKVAYGVGT